MSSPATIPQPISSQEFAGRIRSKYPGAYDGVSDDELTQRVIAKYPQYKSLVSMQAAQQPSDSIQSRPAGAMSWLEDLGSDIKHGTGATAPGRLLQKMGAPGIESGTTEDTANRIAGPLIGPVRAAHGIGETFSPDSTLSQRVRGAKEAMGGAFDAAGPALAFGAPEGAEDIANQAGKLDRYGSTLWGAVKGAAGRVPIAGPMARGALRGAVQAWKSGAPAEEALETTGPRLIERMGGKPVETITDRPSGRLVLLPEEAQAEGAQMSLAKRMASQRGMQYAAGMRPTNPELQ